MKRSRGYLLIAAVLISLLSICAFAAETKDPKVVPEPDFSVTVMHINPEFERMGLKVPERRPGDAAASASCTVNSLAQAGVSLREQMEQRVDYVKITVQNYVFVDDKTLSDDWLTILNTAFEHTGIPTQGDYIMRHYSLSAGKISNSGVFTFDITYKTTAEQEKAVDDAVDALLDEWDQVYDIYDVSDYKKVSVIYDYICSNVVYDFEHLAMGSGYPLMFTAYGALIDGTAVCQGYGNLFYRLALELDVDARFISGDGYTSNGLYAGPHGWNIVQMGDYYYNLDSTWDAGMQEYSFFLRGNAEGTDFVKRHVPDDTFLTEDFTSAYPISETDYTDFGLKIVLQERSGKPELSWSAVDGAEIYEIYRSTQRDGEYKKIASLTMTTLIDTTAQVGVTYYYKICALHKSADSEYSNLERVTCSPAQPVVTVSINSNGKPYLEWKVVDGAEKYELWRADGADGTYRKIWTGTTTRVVHNSAVADEVYRYQVRAVAGEAYSAYSEEISITVPGDDDLAAPVVSVKLNGNDKPVISWDKVYGAEEYEFWRKDGMNGEYKKFITTPKLSLTHTKAEPGQTYSYKVRAVRGDVYSEFSDEVRITIPEDDLGVPTITLTNNASTGKIVVKWNKVDGAEKYELWRSSSKDGAYKKVWTGTKLTLTHSSAQPGETFYYKVRAVSGDVLGKFSEGKARTCDLPRPVVTVTLNSKGKPVVSWNAVDGAVGYALYRSTSPDGGFTKVWTGTKTRLTHTSAEKGVTYYYKVVAICSNSAGNSAYSTVKSVTVK